MTDRTPPAGVVRFAAAAAVAAAAGVLSGRRRQAPAPAPAVRPVPHAPRSGGRRLGRPVLWGEPSTSDPQPQAYVGTAESEASSPTKAQRVMSWVAVGLMLLGVITCAVAFVGRSWPLGAVGVVVGAVGAVLALRFHILDEVSVTQTAESVDKA